MSQGHGRIERKLLAALQDNEQAGLREAIRGLTTSHLAGKVYFDRPMPARLLSPAELGAVRRALSRLTREGFVIRLGYDNKRHWRRGLR